MFGCIVAGRPVQTNLQQVDATRFIFELAEPQAIHHLVVFLLGVYPLPAGYGASIHLLFPPSPGVGITTTSSTMVTSPSWMPLGYVCNEKPSAIFRVSSPPGASSPSLPMASPVAQLGISIETMDHILTQFPSSKSNTLSLSASPSTSAMDMGDQETALVPFGTTATSPETLVAIAMKLATHCYHHCMSFVVGEMIPVKALSDWFASVERKIRNDPTPFLPSAPS